MQDPRNVTDEFKGMPHDSIVAKLDKRGVELEIAVENTLRDYNMGSIVRTANAFGVRHVHVIGRRQWNKRGAMATEKYLHLHYHSSANEFAKHAKENQKSIIAIDNVTGSVELSKTNIPLNAIMVFGQEGPGISDVLLRIADDVVAIEQLGSTRSINVSAAAAIAMYSWTQRHS